MKHLLLLLALCCTFTRGGAQNITLQPNQGHMSCNVRAGHLKNQVFALGLPETIGSSQGMILNFPETNVQWTGPDAQGAVHSEWIAAGKVEYAVTVRPYADYVDVEMTIKNLTRDTWTNVFSFNCLNPVNAPRFLDWTLERTYMSKNGQPFRMDGTTRINNGSMSTVQFYVNEDVVPVSPFVNAFKATSPDKTDDSYIVTLSDDGRSYMAATSPKSCFLFDNLDRCCIHSATNFGTIGAGGEQSVTSRMYLAQGGLSDFLTRFESEIKQEEPVEPSDPRILMCYGNPWVLTDTTQWQYVYDNLDIIKIYIGNIDVRGDTAAMRRVVSNLLAHDIKIAIELGGLLDWHASKGDQVAEASFQQDYANVLPLINLIKSIDPSKSIDMLDMDGPIRRMLFPQNVKSNYQTLESAIDELLEVVEMWRNAVPGIEINLLTNFPNWAWGTTPSYFAISGEPNGYGQYKDVLQTLATKSALTGITIDGLTVDNPYDYALGRANSNQPALIAGVDWMQRLDELDIAARAMGLKVNMIFNTNGGRTAQGYSEQTLDFIDLYHDRVGVPDGYWIQSWYQLPGPWLPETEPYTMTNLTMNAMKKIYGIPEERDPALLEPEDGRVYHGVQLMTFVPGDRIGGYLSALNDSTIHPAVRGLFFSIPGTRGPAQSLKELAEFLASSDTIGFIPELSLFLVSDVATDTVIATSNTYDSIIDSVITLCKNYGKRMFLRIGGEFNGQGEGWNGGGYSPHHYVTMFQKITDMFAARGFRDSIATIWCYEPAAANDFDSVDVNGPLWYPGDDYVDWFGLDVFNASDFDLDAPAYARGVISPKGKSERFLAMARMKGKPVYMSETSAKGINISADPADGVADWNAWFAKFWAFIDAHKEIKGFSYINALWPEHAYAGWGDAQIQNSAYVSSMYRAEMLKPKYIHLPYSALTSVGHPLAQADGIALHQNYPNPFNPTTVIPYTVHEAGVIRIAVYDIHGREVAQLVNDRKAPGDYTALFDASSLPAGMYICRMWTGGKVHSIKAVLAK